MASSSGCTGRGVEAHGRGFTTFKDDDPLVTTRIDLALLTRSRTVAKVIDCWSSIVAHGSSRSCIVNLNSSELEEFGWELRLPGREEEEEEGEDECGCHLNFRAIGCCGGMVGEDECMFLEMFFSIELLRK